MSDRLYTQVLPGGSVSEIQSEKGQRVSAQAGVSGGSATVEQTGTRPGVRALSGSFRGRDSELMASEVEELFSAPDIGTVPFFRVDGPSIPGIDGYYALQNVSQSPADPRASNLFEFEGKMISKGTQRSHWRAVRFNKQTPGNPFGTGDTAYVAVPAVASKVRWWDETGGSLSNATPVETASAQFGEVDRYDPANASSADALIYEIPYEEEGKTDVKLWDDYGRSKGPTRVRASTHVGSATVGGGDNIPSVRWQKVFAPEHRFEGSPTFENGLFRLVFDESVPDVRAYRWDENLSDYTKVSLTDSGWEPFDVDVTVIGLARIEAQITFENTSNGTLYPLDLIVERGRPDPLFTRPPTESGSVPSGLINRLDEIASTAPELFDPKKALVARDQTRR